MISIAMNCDSANASCLLNTATLGLIHMVPNRHPGERGTHRDETKKEPISFKMVIVVLACLLPMLSLLSGMAVLYHVKD